MRQIELIREVKKGSKWETVYTLTNKEDIYKELSDAMVTKYLTKASWIKSIRRTQNYDGTITVTVNYDKDLRSIITVEDN